jgi:hypothetical protein
VTTLEPRSLDIVSQHLSLSESERFDLILATNVFVYYDELERALSLVNLEQMLEPNGVFLSNSPLGDCPRNTLHPVGAVDVKYSAADGDDDQVEMYSNSALRRGMPPQ